MNSSYWNFLRRRWQRQWRTNAAILVCLVLASALLAGFSSYNQAVATWELQESLEDAGAPGRTLYISGNRYTFNEALYERLQSGLVGVFQERLVIRHATSLADPLVAAESSRSKRTVALLDLYSFDQLSERVVVVAGRFPDQVRLSEAVDTWRPPPIEAVIGEEAARQSGYGIGDHLTGSGTYHRLQIVGVVAPLNPQEDTWGNDLSAFQLHNGRADRDAKAVNLPLIIAPASMRSHYPERPIFPHEIFWRITLHPELISARNAKTLHSGLINFQTQTATMGATTATGLIPLLGDYLARVSRVRVVFSLFTTQAFVMVLITLTLVASSMVQRSRLELAMLSAHGASEWQITRIFALEILLLALPAALLLGPGLAQGAILLWEKGQPGGSPLPMPREAWLLSGIAVGIGWLAVVLPIYLAARRNTRAASPLHLAFPPSPRTQRPFLDLYLLLFSGLLYWQLNQSGSFLLRRLGDTQLADPLLLIGPTLFLIAIALVSLRVLPFGLQLFARALKNLRSPVPLLGVLRLARYPRQPSGLILLVGVTAGLAFFTRSFEASLAASQEAAARFQAGADLRVSLDVPTVLEEGRLSALPGVQTFTVVWRWEAHTQDSRTIQALAVDPDTFSKVAPFPVGFTGSTIPGSKPFLSAEGKQVGTSTGLPPAIFSATAIPEGVHVGDPISIGLDGHHLAFGLQATTMDFPTLSGDFMVVRLSDLVAQLSPAMLERAGSREAWLMVDPLRHASLVRNPSLQDRLLIDREVRSRTIQSDALALGTSRVFQLGTLAMVWFSVWAYTIVQFAGMRERGYEFEVLRRLGLSSAQLLSLSAVEGLLVLVMGLATGILIGIGLTQIMMPYVFEALAESLAGSAFHPPPIEWSGITRLSALLFAAYGSGLAGLLVALARARSFQSPGLAVET